MKSNQSTAARGRRQDAAPDPVCGTRVAVTRRTLSEEYAGTTYYFCSQGCLDRFTQDADIFTMGLPEGRLATYDRGIRPASAARQNSQPAAHPTFEQPPVDAGPG